MPSKIEWTQETWNPITGCSKVSEGCRNCYAERMSRRLAGRHGYPEAPHHFDVTLRPDRLDEPLRRKKPTMYFVCSMSDLFHSNIPDEFIHQVFWAMGQCPQHTFQILTKRPLRMQIYLQHHEARLFPTSFANIFPNIWLGVSVENQETANERREYLRQCPAIIKFVSYEPALDLIDWTGWEFVDQIISGGESGPRARPSCPDWHRATRDFCQEHGIAYFFKQWGEFAPWGGLNCEHFHQYNCDEMDKKYRSEVCQPYVMYRVGKKAAGRLLDGRAWDEMPNGRA